MPAALFSAGYSASTKVSSFGGQATFDAVGARVLRVLDLARPLRRDRLRRRLGAVVLFRIVVLRSDGFLLFDDRRFLLLRLRLIALLRRGRTTERNSRTVVVAHL